jgi:hypothetical protein
VTAIVYIDHNSCIIDEHLLRESFSEDEPEFHHCCVTLDRSLNYS